MSVSATAPPPQLRLLGGFTLSLGGQPLPVCPAVQRLLALLALYRRPLVREAVAGRLWPDAPPGRGAGSLRSTLWRLPKPAASALLSVRPDALSLAPAVRVDLTDAESRLRALLLAGPEADADPGVVDRLAQVCLPEGELLPQWWDEWVVLERERLRQLRLHALEATARALCRHQRWDLALDAALVAVAAEPLRETAHRLVIEVHLAEGNAGEALRHYEDTRRLLRRELNLPPSAALRALVAPVLSAARDG